jgi:glc operon protein GlcG
MAYTHTTQTLTDAAVLALLTAAEAKAAEMNQPQCIVIADTSAVVLGCLRMVGARVLSMKSATTKAQTAASIGNASGSIAEPMKVLLALATGGNVTGLPGGLPIRFGGVLVGGIGVGSGTGAQDEEVARAALAAIGADPV